MEDDINHEQGNYSKRKKRMMNWMRMIMMVMICFGQEEDEVEKKSFTYLNVTMKNILTFCATFFSLFTSQTQMICLLLRVLCNDFLCCLLAQLIMDNNTTGNTLQVSIFRSFNAFFFIMRMKMMVKASDFVLVVINHQWIEQHKKMNFHLGLVLS